MNDRPLTYKSISILSFSVGIVALYISLKTLAGTAPEVLFKIFKIWLLPISLAICIVSIRLSTAIWKCNSYVDFTIVLKQRRYLPLVSAIVFGVLAFYAIFIFIASFAGHPPYTAIGIYIIPVSIICGIVCVKLSGKLLRLSKSSKIPKPKDDNKG